MKVAGIAGAGQIVVQIVLLVGTFANVADVAVRVDVVHESQPGLACRRRIRLLVQPAVFYAGDHRESEHSCR